MKVNELSKQLDVTNKVLIDFLKSNGYKISSHMQNVTDEMIDLATKNFSNDNAKEVKESVEVSEEKKVDEKTEEHIPMKTFRPDDMIPCKSVTPWKLIALGVDKTTTYNWEYYGDVDYVAYRDLQALRRTSYITKPKIIIEDADLCYQWRRELGDTYKYFLDVEYPEEFFDLDDYKFEELLKKAPNVVKEVIKVTAMNMIKNENYPEIRKLKLIDEIFGTCLTATFQ